MAATTEQKRRALELRETTDLSFTQIGRLTGLSKGSVRGIVVRAKAGTLQTDKAEHPLPRPGRARSLCQWIFGEPGPGQHWVDMDKCNEAALPGRPYCDLHYARTCHAHKG